MKKHENLILLLLVVLIAAFPLVWNVGAEFGGADDQVKDVVAEINPDYKPWFSAIWRERTNPMPEPSFFVVKKGTKRLLVPETP